MIFYSKFYIKEENNAESLVDLIIMITPTILNSVY